jgi:REP element-mobilizing transposase RayT
MSDYNANFHHRKSMRLKGYDYSRSGFYAITLCIQDRECLLGKIDSQQLILNDAGQMVVKWHAELTNKFPEILCHEMVVMPNHLHCILQIDGNDADIPPDNRAYWRLDKHGLGAHAGYQQNYVLIRSDAHAGYQQDNVLIPADAHAGAPLHWHPIPNPDNQSHYVPANKKYHATIGAIVGWFKTMTTNEYIRGVKTQGWKRFDGKLWQRNYWDDIILSDESLDRITDYILHNPERWEEDQLNPVNAKEESSEN